MKILLLLTLLFGFSVPFIAYGEFNGGDAMHKEPKPICIRDCHAYPNKLEMGEDSGNDKSNRIGII